MDGVFLLGEGGRLAPMASRGVEAWFPMVMPSHESHDIESVCVMQFVAHSGLCYCNTKFTDLEILSRPAIRGQNIASGTLCGPQNLNGVARRTGSVGFIGFIQVSP